MTFDVHTLLYASAAMVMGFQAIQFWVFARIHGAQQGVAPGPAELDQDDRRSRACAGEVAMIDPSDVELAAMKKCLRPFGEAAGGIGFDKPLGAYSEAEALRVIDRL